MSHTDNESVVQYFLNELGVGWYLDWGTRMSRVPDGMGKLPFLPVPTNPDLWLSGQVEMIESLTDEQIGGMGFLRRSQLRQMAAAAPGSYWYIFGEPNRYGYMTGARFAPVFHYYVTQIKLADPTAKIVGTSLLNWDYTCIGCQGQFYCSGPIYLRGYECGKKWFQEFLVAYEGTYGQKPPVDVWAIDVYPIDWLNVPNNAPDQLAEYRERNGRFMHWEIAVLQIQGFREYLDTIPEYVDTPIWVTEIGIHVGFDGIDWDKLVLDGTIVPLGERGTPRPGDPGRYNYDKMSDYVIQILDWFEANATNNKIEKWFFLATYTDYWDGDEDLGIRFFEGPEVGSPLNCLGEIYRSRSLGLPNVHCNSLGETVPD